MLGQTTVEASHKFGSGKSLGRVVAISDKWSGELPRNRLVGSYEPAGGPNFATSLIQLSPESRNRSLGAPLTNAEASAYLGPRKPFAPQRSHLVSVNLGAGPSELLAFRPRVS